MKITISQINTTPNDFVGNFNKIKTGIETALHDKADVVIFPELSIPGYLVRDLVFTTGFVEKNLSYLQRIAEMTFNNNLAVIVGYIDRNHTGFGKPFRNMAAVIRQGGVVATYQKRLLPTYNVFEEGIWYEPGHDSCIFEVNGEKCAIVICEDLWLSDKGETGNIRYFDDPLKDIKRLGVKYVFSLNSSPYARNKPKNRVNMLNSLSAENDCNIIYCNQIGGNDELVFDGHSLISSQGQLIKYFITDIKPWEDINIYETVEINRSNAGRYIDCDYDTDHLRMTLLGLHDYIKKCGFKSVVLGSSGGVDSAIVATLATLAIGKENVNCIMMPSCYSSEGSVKDAKELHRRLGCNEFLVPIEHKNLTNHINRCFKFVDIVDLGRNGDTEPKIRQLVDYNKIADENIQARMRGQIVMHYSNAMNALALTTGNKTELSTGYCTMGGDMLGGFNPIGDLYKMEVFAMCKQINEIFGNPIPTEITSKPPSAELKPDQTDEASLLPYPTLDNIVRLYVEKYVSDWKQYTSKSPVEFHVSETDYNRITRLVYISEFKRRQAAPTIKLSNIAFGTGRRMPITKK